MQASPYFENEILFPAMFGTECSISNSRVDYSLVIKFKKKNKKKCVIKRSNLLIKD